MNYKRRLLVSLLCVLLCCSGCSINGTRIVFGELKVNKPEYIFQINDSVCNRSIAKLFLANYRNLYGNAYGIDLWKNDYEADQMEQYVKDMTLSELSKMMCMNLIAEQMQLTLSDEELALVDQAAEEYYGSLNSQEKEVLEISQTDVRKAYADYAMARHLFALLTDGIDEEVSDDEARVIRVMQIYTLDQETAEIVQEKLDGGDDFAAVASTYNRAEEIERNVAREEYPQAVENIAFNLDNGAISEMIVCEEGYYFVKCLSKLEEQLTDENKEHIREKRRKEVFDREYETFLETANFTLNEENWNLLSAKGLGEVSTDSFFEVYRKYFGDEVVVSE